MRTFQSQTPVVRLRVAWGDAQVLGVSQLLPEGQGCQPPAPQPVTAPRTPQAVLAATIIVNLKGMVLQFRDICFLWEANRVDLVSSRGQGGRGLSPSTPRAL